MLISNDNCYLDPIVRQIIFGHRHVVAADREGTETMKMEAWEHEFEQAFRLCNLEYRPMYSAIALQKLEQDKKLAVDMKIAMERYFWRRVCDRQPFGDTRRVADQFGRSLEENYGVEPGPFLDLAECYWTFQIEMRDVLPAYFETWLAQALIAVESELRTLFFPTPGPIAMPRRLRKSAQRTYLQQAAPDFPIERYLKENPMLRGWWG